MESRNMHVWQNAIETSQAILKRARQLLNGWRTTKNTKQQSGVVGTGVGTHTSEHMSAVREVTMLLEQPRQQNSGLGRLECNVDVSFSNVLNCVAFGLCIQDKSGTLLRLRRCGRILCARRILVKRWGFHMLFIGCPIYDLQIWTLNWMQRIL